MVFIPKGVSGAMGSSLPKRNVMQRKTIIWKK